MLGLAPTPAVVIGPKPLPGSHVISMPEAVPIKDPEEPGTDCRVDKPASALGLDMPIRYDEEVAAAGDPTLGDCDICIPGP